MATTKKTGIPPVEAAALPDDTHNIGPFANGPSDPRDRLTAKAGQMAALTALLSAEGFDAFNRLGDDHKQNVLWLAHDLASEVEALASVVTTSSQGDAS